MTEKQEKLLYLYREIDDICKRNDIEYYMSGGTLLGAVRHRGFIPWDDDMDLYMTRNNWFKFLKVCETQLPPDRKVECQELDRGYYNMFGRYVDTKTTAIHSAQLFFDDTAGFVVDILVLDPLPDDDEFYERYLRDLMLYSDLINGTVVYSYRWKNNRFRYNYYRFLASVMGKDKVLGELEKRMFSYPEENCTRFAMRWGGAPFIFPKEMFSGVKWAKFEDVDCPIPPQTCAYLIWHYGDEWMFIPPHSDHESHDAIYSLQMNYQPVRQEILAMTDAGKMNRAYRTRKSRVLASMNAFHEANDEKIYLKAEAYSIDLSRKFETRREEILSLYGKNSFGKLSQIFSEFYSAQCNKDFIGREDFANIYRFHRPIIIKITDEIFEIAIYTLINTERISKAMRLIEIHEKLDGKLSDSLQKAKQTILDFRKAVCAYEEHELDFTFSTAARLLEEYPCCVSFLKFKIRLLLEKSSAADLKEASALVERGLSISPESGDFLKYKTDLVFKENPQAAFEDYITAYALTQNGITQLEIADIIRDNADSFVSLVEEYRAEDLLHAQELVRQALEIVPGSMPLITEKCELQLDNFKSDLSRFFKSEKIILWELKSSGYDEGIFEIYNRALHTYVDNDKVVSLLLEYRKADEYGEFKSFYEKMLMLVKSEKDKALLGWYYLLLGNVTDEIGKNGQDYYYYLEALRYCKNDEALELSLKNMFLLDLSKTCRNLSVADKKLNSFGSAGFARKLFKKDSVLPDGTVAERESFNYLSEVVIDRWTDKYPTIRSALDFYGKLGLLTGEAVKYIDTFNLFNLDDTESPWSLSSLSTLKKICFGMGNENNIDDKDLSFDTGYDGVYEEDSSAIAEQPGSETEPAQTAETVSKSSSLDSEISAG